MSLRSFHIYAGIGAHALGFQRAGFAPVGFCENDPFCRQALKALGNCNPPQIPYLIGRWIVNQEVSHA